MIENKTEQNLHPEGLTPKQEKLLDLYVTTKIEAKVGRRRRLPNGKFELYKVVRLTSPFDFAQEDEFALKGHEKNIENPLSPYYVNQRNLPNNVYAQIGSVLAEIKTEISVDFCTGVPEAGTNIAKAYSFASGVPYVEIFSKEEKDSNRKIVGKKTAGEKKKLRIVDDLVTGANSILEAVREAGYSGYEIVDIVVVLDREQGGPKQLAEKGIKLYRAFKITQLFDYYLRRGRITEEKYDECRMYLDLLQRRKL